MKKRMSLCALLLICVMLLASCDGLLQVLPAPFSASQLQRRVDMKMAEVQSYRVDVEMTYTARVSSTKITGNAEGVMIEDTSSDDYYSYMELINEMKRGSDTYRVRNVEAYIEGQAFSIFGDGKATRKLISEMSREQYDAYREGDSLLEINLQDCKDSKLEKTDGGFKAVYSGYSAAAVQEFSDFSGMDEEIFGKELKDLIVTMEASSDYLPSKITMELVFDVEEDASFKPECVLTMTFSQFGQAERITSGFAASNFTRIESLSLLDDLQQLIDDRINAAEGSFLYTARQQVSFMAQSQTEEQTSDVSFTRGKDGIWFEADVRGDGVTSYHTEYKNGEKITETNGIEKTTNMTEEEADEFIANLILDPAVGYNSNYVSDVEKTDTGYLVTMLVSKNSSLGQTIISAGASFGRGTHTIEFVLNGDELVAINVEYEASGAVSYDTPWGQSSASLNLTGYSRVEFD